MQNKAPDSDEEDSDNVNKHPTAVKMLQNGHIYLKYPTLDLGQEMLLGSCWGEIYWMECQYPDSVLETVMDNILQETQQ